MSDDTNTPDGDADLVIHNAEINTVDEDDSVHEAMAVKDGRVQAVGEGGDIRNQYVGEDTETLDLDGHTVVPGLQDSHIHVQGLGEEVENFAILTTAVTHDDVVDLLEASVEEKGFVADDERDELYEEAREDVPRGWILARRWDEINIRHGGEDDGMIPRWKLEKEFEYGDHPVHAARNYKGVYVNTAIFNLMGIYDDDPETWPDWWTEDPDHFTSEERIIREERTIETVDGETITEAVPTGVFIGQRQRRPDLLAPPETGTGPVESLDLGADELLRHGIVSFCDAAAWNGEPFRLARESVFPLRVNLWHGSFFDDDDTPAPVIDDVLGGHQDRGWFGGDRWFRQDGCKFHTDGGDVVRSAAVSEPYENWQELEGYPPYGELFVDDWVRESMMCVPFERGYKLHSHGVGDVAARQIVDIYMRYYEEMREENEDIDPRFSVEHATLANERDVRVTPDETNNVLEDMAEYDVVASVQGILIWQFGDAFIEQNGAERAERAKPMQSMIDAGITVANGTDFFVADYNPGYSLYGSMERKALGSGRVFGEEERVSADDALRTYTYNGAYFMHEEDVRGSLEPGKVADFVVLDVESWQGFEDDPEQLLDWEELVQWTVVEGITGYQDESFAREADDDPSRPSDEELPDYVVGADGSDDHVAGPLDPIGEDGFVGMKPPFLGFGYGGPDDAEIGHHLDPELGCYLDADTGCSHDDHPEHHRGN